MTKRENFFLHSLSDSTLLYKTLVRSVLRRDCAEEMYSETLHLDMLEVAEGTALSEWGHFICCDAEAGFNNAVKHNDSPSEEQHDHRQ